MQLDLSGYILFLLSYHAKLPPCQDMMDGKYKCSHGYPSGLAFDFNGRLPASLCNCLRGFSSHLLLFPPLARATPSSCFFFHFSPFYLSFFIILFFAWERSCEWYGMELEGTQRDSGD
ncbi:hypothetical protein TNIN_442921 [Trichonephila inaurata madagascariensis]|uniref:Uncharacterized protein n=1 Tax=Trichonephila inaurata madagascariensis TaxID=2747483 RepID=A0A8X6JWI0_9ARAC|nr:hypothetical protein TNIN_442921 [Trichonephila inaurata madagascariensis]